MASNSLFSTVTPCQQNFFWGEYCFAGCFFFPPLLEGGLGARVTGRTRGQVLRFVELKGLGKTVLDRMEEFASR